MAYTLSASLSLPVQRLSCYETLLLTLEFIIFGYEFMSEHTQNNQPFESTKLVKNIKDHLKI